VIHATSLERELGHQTIAERIFDEMERGLSRLLESEEQRPVEQYAVEDPRSEYDFVVGYFEIDPDGRIEVKVAEREGPQPTAAEIEGTVASYWQGGRAPAAPAPPPAQLPGTTVGIGEKQLRAAAPSQPEAKRDTPKDASVSAFDVLRSLNKGVQERAARQRREDEGIAYHRELATDERNARGFAAESVQTKAQAGAPSADDGAPLVGRVIDESHLILYRTVLRGKQGLRQGLLLDVDALSDWLREQGLGDDGVVPYASVWFATPFSGQLPAAESGFTYLHRFAEPFDDLSARLTLRQLPGVGSVTYVWALSALLLAAAALGLAALYRMVSVAVRFGEQRSNFVAAVSHELKTPLTAIRMYGEMLRDGIVSSDAKRKEYYRHITVESERLSRLINNVLEFSHLEKGTRQMTLASGSPVPVMRDVAELLRPHVEGAGFDLRVIVDGEPPAVSFERDALVQVLCNLVDNAVKYAGPASTREIDLRCWHDAAGVHVSVRDHGPGVSSRHLGHIFEPFYRAESELTRRSKGTGLGLALVRGLVERMGARVSGRNVPDGGFEADVVFRVAGV
jgi:signal transduction histidine kinase